MKGNNTIIMNEATLIGIMQAHFDDALFSRNNAPRVTGIKGNVTDGTFTVTTEEKPPQDD